MQKIIQDRKYFRSTTPSPQLFNQNLVNGYLVQYLIVLLSDRGIKGYVLGGKYLNVYCFVCQDCGVWSVWIVLLCLSRLCCVVCLYCLALSVTIVVCGLSGLCYFVCLYCVALSVRIVVCGLSVLCCFVCNDCVVWSVRILPCCLSLLLYTMLLHVYILRNIIGLMLEITLILFYA